MKTYAMLRKADAAFKENAITEETPDAEIIQLIAANPGLLQRPIVEVGDKAVLARPIENALDLIGNI